MSSSPAPSTPRKGRGSRLAATAAVGSIMALLGAGFSALPAAAHDPGRQATANIVRALETQAEVFLDTPEIPEGQVTVSSGTVTAPAGTGSRVEVSLPASELSQLGVEGAASGEAATSEGSRLAVVDEGDGAFRALIHVPSRSAPREYVFPVGGGYALVPQEDGGVEVLTAAGEVAGYFAAPWAVDARGAEVPTHYLVSGSSLVQRIVPGPHTVFPVVADPFWIPFLGVVAIIGRHVAQRVAARGVSEHLIRQTVLTGRRIPSRGGTTVFVSGRNKATRIRVVVNNKTGRVVTVTRGSSQY